LTAVSATQEKFAESASVGNLRIATERRLVSQTFASWNRIAGWLRQIEALRGAA
jgi:hypothetical protein